MILRGKELCPTRPPVSRHPASPVLAAATAALPLTCKTRKKWAGSPACPAGGEMAKRPWLTREVELMSLADYEGDYTCPLPCTVCKYLLYHALNIEYFYMK